MKSSSTCLIPASLCEGPFFYFYVESSSSTLKALLESIAVILSAMCLSQNTVNYGITLMLVSLIFLLLVFSWTSEVPQHLNKGKLDTTLPYHLWWYLLFMVLSRSCIHILLSGTRGPKVTEIGITGGDGYDVRITCVHRVLMLCSGTLLKWVP
jgi:hypothetical protein